MACRYIDTKIWSEDWFCEMGAEYQLFFSYITCECDNAGIWKPNKIDFEIKSRAKINLDSFLQKVNESGSKERILVTEGGRWFLTGFIAFQWFNKTEAFDLALSNKLHLHIFQILEKNKIPITKVRGLREVLQTSKDKVKDKVIENKKKEPEISELKTDTPDDLFADYEHWTAQIISKSDQFFDQMLMKERLSPNGQLEFIAKDHLSMLARYPKQRPPDAHKFRLSLLKHIRENFKKETHGNPTGKKQQHTANIAASVTETYRDVLASG